ncbi:MAG: hypothetical protein FWF81_04190 [Defluviitaleaceae bacterium]|nr:hypothetical protein [Defluviitaleaceae bacterium]
MKKLFLILCATLIFTIPVYADEFLENRVANLEAQLAALLAALDAMPPTDHGAIHLQRQEAVHLERFMFRMKYYNVCLNIAQNQLLTHRRELTERQLELEEVRLELGLTTQNNIDDLAALLDGLTQQIELNNETIQINKQHIETRRGQQGYEFIRNFQIPSPTSANARTLDELRTNLIRNNVALATLESHIRQAFQSGMSWHEIQLLEEQRALLTRQLEMAAINSRTTYLAAKTGHNLARDTRPLLDSRLELVDEMFYLGELSEVEKKELRFNIYTELHIAEQVAIALAMSIAELNFMMLGIS